MLIEKSIKNDIREELRFLDDDTFQKVMQKDFPKQLENKLIQEFSGQKNSSTYGEELETTTEAIAIYVSDHDLNPEACGEVLAANTTFHRPVLF